MPIIPIYESELAIYGSTRLAVPLVILPDWSFDSPKIAGRTEGKMFVRRWWFAERFVKAPALSRLVDFKQTIAERPWSTPPRALAVWWDESGLLAETVAWAAQHGHRGFEFVTKESI